MEMETIVKFDELIALINIQRKLIDELYDEKIKMTNQILKMDKQIHAIETVTKVQHNRIWNLEQQHP